MMATKPFASKTSLLAYNQPMQFIIPMQTMQFGRATRKRAKEVLAFEVKKLDSIEMYFDKLMRRRNETPTGFIDLPRRNFEDILKHHVHTEEDYSQMLSAFYNYLGHRNSFPQESTDALLTKALTLKKPELAYDLLGNHAELLIHPRAKVIRSFFNFVTQSGEWD